MPLTPSQAAKKHGITSGQLQGRPNEGQKASSSRGRDTVSNGAPVTYPSSAISGQGRIEQTGKGIGFDNRSNTVSGREKEQPYEAANGARLVGDTKLKVKAPQAGSSHDKFSGNVKTEQFGRPGAQRFRIEDGNHAKRIDQDAEPK
jgi:hypothetical protein